MSLSLEQLDDSHKSRDSILIVGDNILLKYLPEKSILDEHTKFKSVLVIPDLPSSPNFVSLKNVAKASFELKDKLSEYVTETNKEAKSIPKLKNLRSDIKKISEDVVSHERALGVSITNERALCFCSKCDSLVGEYSSVTNKCQCGTNIEESDILRVFFLDGRPLEFIKGGSWFEDYVAGLLRRDGWKVWTHGKVLGASGMFHPVDLLAVKGGIVIIAECKTGNVMARDISHFYVQKIDINPRFGYFFSFNSCAEKDIANIVKNRGDFLLIDGAQALKDSDLVAKINDHIGKFI